MYMKISFELAAIPVNEGERKGKLIFGDKIYESIDDNQIKTIMI